MAKKKNNKMSKVAAKNKVARRKAKANKRKASKIEIGGGFEGGPYYKVGPNFGTNKDTDTDG